MFKYFLALMLAVISGHACAGWTITPYASGGDGTYYWDAQHIEFRGSLLTIWIADDFDEAQISKFKSGEKYFALEEELEIDCTVSKSRMIDYIELSDHLGSGSVIFQDKQKAKWNRIAPDGLTYHVETTFCKKG
jgi:hypothetical protein